jgi:hypothetical protein
MIYVVACDAGTKGMCVREEECGQKGIDKSSAPFVVDNTEGLLLTIIRTDP